MMDMLLRFQSDKMDDEDLQVLIRRVRDSLNEETDISATMPTREVDNAKGTLTELGALALGGIGPDTLKALLGFIERLLLRESHLEIEVTKTDGSVLKINAKNKSSKEVASLLNQLQQAQAT